MLDERDGNRFVRLMDQITPVWFETEINFESLRHYRAEARARPRARTAP